ncbi:MAG TPA: hypothetical protein VMP68_17345 [Candidatus Eisenbacteria bacterium]|nr:hypothetical protein [Candidatus Eisenbacteria bacterium]
MKRLATLIQNEKNHAKFMEYIQALNRLLERKERRIDPTSPEHENPRKD